MWVVGASSGDHRAPRRGLCGPGHDWLHRVSHKPCAGHTEAALFLGVTRSLGACPFQGLHLLREGPRGRPGQAARQLRLLCPLPAHPQQPGWGARAVWSTSLLLTGCPSCRLLGGWWPRFRKTSARGCLLPVVAAGRGGAPSWDGRRSRAGRLTGPPSLPVGSSAAASG